MARRTRGKGEGSIGRHPDGRWYARISIGWVNGKRKRRPFYGKSRKEVHAALTKALRDRQQGLPISSGVGQRLGSYLTRWLEHVKPSIRPRTYERFEGIVRLHVTPDLGKIRLERLTPEHVQQLLNRKLAAGLSAQSVRHIRTILGIALKRAVKWNLVGRNAAALTDGPKVERAPITPLSADEARRLLAAVSGHRLEAFYLIALALGLRRGEALGLSWDDLDQDARTMQISRALQRAEGKLQLLPLKTKSSHRTIRLPEVVVRALQRHKASQAQERLAAGADWKGATDNLIFATETGTRLEPRNVNRNFKLALKRAVLSDTKLHNLRHTAATLMLAEGVPAKVVQEILGHSKISTTLDVYSHTTPGLMNDAAIKMDAVLSR